MIFLNWKAVGYNFQAMRRTVTANLSISQHTTGSSECFVLLEQHANSRTPSFPKQTVYRLNFNTSSTALFEQRQFINFSEVL